MSTRIPIEYIELHEPGTTMPAMTGRTTSRSAYVHRSAFRIEYAPENDTLYVSAREGDTIGTYEISIPAVNAWQYKVATKPAKAPEFPTPDDAPVHAGQIPIAKRQGQ